MKKCSNNKCEVLEPEFCKNKSNKDGLQRRCKICCNREIETHRKTKIGVATRMFFGQKQRSEKKGWPIPDYSKQELRDWLFSQPLFHVLYDAWVKSGHEKNLKPSCDRKDDYGFYTLDNLQVTTWKKNVEKGHEDRKNGINNKISKAVIQMDLDGSEIEMFHSHRVASRKTGIDRWNISKCCTDNRKTAGGYKWKHAS